MKMYLGEAKDAISELGGGIFKTYTTGLGEAKYCSYIYAYNWSQYRFQ